MNIGTNSLVDELKDKILLATEDLTHCLILEADLIKTGTAIKTEYVLKIGKYEIERYNLYFEHVKLKRKIELYQAAINKQQRISHELVENIIKQETIEYQTELNRLISDLHTANQIAKADSVTDEDLKMIKETYRFIVMKIHPDLKVDQTDNDKFLWNMTQNAYLDNDLQQLLLVKSLIGNNDIDIKKENQIDLLEKENMTLIFNIDLVKDRMNKMKNSFPFTKISLLQEEEAIKKIVKEIIVDINTYKQYNDELLERLKSLIDSLKKEGNLNE